MEDGVADSHQHLDGNRNHARNHELRRLARTSCHRLGKKSEIGRSPLPHEEAVIFYTPVIKVTVIKVIKDSGFSKYPSTSLYLIK